MSKSRARYTRPSNYILYYLSLFGAAYGATNSANSTYSKGLVDLSQTSLSKLPNFGQYHQFQNTTTLSDLVDEDLLDLERWRTLGADDDNPGGPPVTTQSPSRQPTRSPTLTPTQTPTLSPTVAPTFFPSLAPTPVPSNPPTIHPTVQPTGQPSLQPTGQPSKRPSRQPTGQPSRQPSGKPSNQPTNSPSGQPSSRPSLQPISRPTSVPSMQPTGQPTSIPSSQPSFQPTSRPTSIPSQQPSRQPTTQPSRKPTSQPSRQPTAFPTSQPTSQPTIIPTSQPTEQPSVVPTGQPTSWPTLSPSAQPTQQPTSGPSSLPSGQPTNQPSSTPSVSPSSFPSLAPSSLPTGQPSSRPSWQPTISPSGQPTGQPSRSPTSTPSSRPTSTSTSLPTSQPTSIPSSFPTLQPTRSPTSQPSSIPSSFPTFQPTSQPSVRPTSWPTFSPSGQPTLSPSGQPSSSPSGQPSRRPSSQPSVIPTGFPTAGPSSSPSFSPSSGPTTSPSTQPSGQPSSSPSLMPSAVPSVRPTSYPSFSPSGIPTSRPSRQPTTRPSTQPTRSPTGQPTSQPSGSPTSQPTKNPTLQPSSGPTSQPTLDPSSSPTSQPSGQPAALPTGQPTVFPSGLPTSSPSAQPSVSPSSTPSAQPWAFPSSLPSSQPTLGPTSTPSGYPSIQPSSSPTSVPSIFPSSRPTSIPSIQPSSSPTVIPSGIPSAEPSSAPTSSPSAYPSAGPSSTPSVSPSGEPSSQPSFGPTSQPSASPSEKPYSSPTGKPSFRPVASPTFRPSQSATSNIPSLVPTSLPSSQPTSQPSSQPTNKDGNSDKGEGINILAAVLGTAAGLVTVGGLIYAYKKHQNKVSPEGVGLSKVHPEQNQENSELIPSVVIYDQDEKRLMVFNDESHYAAYARYLNLYSKILIAVEKGSPENFDWIRDFLRNASANPESYKQHFDNQEELNKLRLGLVASGFNDSEVSQVEEFIRSNAHPELRKDFYEKHFGQQPAILKEGLDYFIGKDGNLVLFGNLSEFDPKTHEIDQDQALVTHKSEERLGDKSNFVEIDGRLFVYDQIPVKHYLNFSRSRENQLINRYHQAYEPICLINERNRLLQFESHEQLEYFLEETRFFDEFLSKLDRSLAGDLSDLALDLEEARARKYENYEEKSKAIVDLILKGERIFDRIPSSEDQIEKISRVKKFLFSQEEKSKPSKERLPKIGNLYVDYAINKDGNIVLYENLTKFDPRLHQIGEDKHSALYIAGSKAGQELLFYIERSPATDQNTYYVFEPREVKANFAYLAKSGDELTITSSRKADPIYIVDSNELLLEFEDEKHFQKYVQHMNFFEDEIVSSLLTQRVAQEKIDSLRHFKAELEKAAAESYTSIEARVERMSPILQQGLIIDEISQFIDRDKLAQLRELVSLMHNSAPESRSTLAYYQKYYGTPPILRRKNEGYKIDGDQNLVIFDNVTRFDSSKHKFSDDRESIIHLDSPRANSQYFEQVKVLGERETIVFDRKIARNGFYKIEAKENGQPVIVAKNYNAPQPHYAFDLDSKLMRFGSDDELDSYNSYLNYHLNIERKLIAKLGENEFVVYRDFLRKLTADLKFNGDPIVDEEAHKAAISLLAVEENAKQIEEICLALEFSPRERVQLNDYLAHLCKAPGSEKFYERYFGKRPTFIAEEDYEIRDGNLIIHSNKRLSTEGTATYSEIVIKEGYACYRAEENNGIIEILIDEVPYLEAQKIHLLHGTNLLTFSGQDQFEACSNHINYLENLKLSLRNLTQLEIDQEPASRQQFEDLKQRELAIFDQAIEWLQSALERNDEISAGEIAESIKRSPEIAHLLGMIGESEKFADYISQVVDPSKTEKFFKKYYGNLPRAEKYRIGDDGTVFLLSGEDPVPEVVDQYFFYEDGLGEIRTIKTKPAALHIIEGDKVYEFSDRVSLNNFISHRRYIDDLVRSLNENGKDDLAKEFVEYHQNLIEQVDNFAELIQRSGDLVGRLSLEEGAARRLSEYLHSINDPELQNQYRVRYNLAPSKTYEKFSYDRNKNLILFDNFSKLEPESYEIVSAEEKTLRLKLEDGGLGDQVFHYLTDESGAIFTYEEAPLEEGYFAQNPETMDFEFSKYRKDPIYLMDRSGKLLEFEDVEQYERYAQYSNYFHDFCGSVFEKIGGNLGEQVKSWLIEGKNSISRDIEVEEIILSTPPESTQTFSGYFYSAVSQLGQLFGATKVSPDSLTPINATNTNQTHPVDSSDFRKMTSKQKLEFIFSLGEVSEEEKSKFSEFLRSQDKEDLRDSYFRKYHGNPPRVIDERHYKINSRGGIDIADGENTRSIDSYHEFDLMGNIVQRTEEVMPPFYLKTREDEVIKFRSRGEYERYASYKNYPQSLIEEIGRDFLPDGEKLHNLITKIQVGSRNSELTTKEKKDLVDSSWKTIRDLTKKYGYGKQEREKLRDYLYVSAGVEDVETYYRKHYGVPPQNTFGDYSIDSAENLIIFTNHQRVIRDLSVDYDIGETSYSIRGVEQKVKIAIPKNGDLEAKKYIITKGDVQYLCDGLTTDLYYRQSVSSNRIERIDYSSVNPCFSIIENGLIRFENQRHQRLNEDFLAYPESLIGEISSRLPLSYEREDHQAVGDLISFITNPEERLEEDREQQALAFISNYFSESESTQIADFIESLKNPEEERVNGTFYRKYFYPELPKMILNYRVVEGGVLLEDTNEITNDPSLVEHLTKILKQIEKEISERFAQHELQRLLENVEMRIEDELSDLDRERLKEEISKSLVQDELQRLLENVEMRIEDDLSGLDREHQNMLEEHRKMLEDQHKMANEDVLSKFYRQVEAKIRETKTITKNICSDALDDAKQMTQRAFGLSVIERKVDPVVQEFGQFSLDRAMRTLEKVYERQKEVVDHIYELDVEIDNKEPRHQEYFATAGSSTNEEAQRQSEEYRLYASQQGRPKSRANNVYLNRGDFDFFPNQRGAASDSRSFAKSAKSKLRKKDEAEAGKQNIFSRAEEAESLMDRRLKTSDFVVSAEFPLLKRGNMGSDEPPILDINALEESEAATRFPGGFSASRSRHDSPKSSRPKTIQNYTKSMMDTLDESLESDKKEDFQAINLSNFTENRGNGFENPTDVADSKDSPQDPKKSVRFSESKSDKKEEVTRPATSVKVPRDKGSRLSRLFSRTEGAANSKK